MVTPVVMFSTLAPDALPIRVPLDRQLELARDHGFDALDVPLSVLAAAGRTESSAAEIARSWAAHGLRCGGWRLPFDYQAPRRGF